LGERPHSAGLLDIGRKIEKNAAAFKKQSSEINIGLPWEATHVVLPKVQSVKTFTLGSGIALGLVMLALEYG
jgi:hypothetical protein